jgi:hypothetical protein
MSKDDVGHHYVVKAFPGATVEDMEDFISNLLLVSHRIKSFFMSVQMT